MRCLTIKSFALVCFIACMSCNDTADVANEALKQDSLKRAMPMSFPARAGLVGVFDVPEMLVLSKMDSSDMKDMAFKLARDYSVLQEEMTAIGAEMDGSPGVINYNSDPKNFKFECILLIKNLPEKEPKQCKIVALEAAKMLIYNYYGPYHDLLNAYNDIRKICAENKLMVSGPMREFYITDPTAETDPKKWLTRIMVPVEDAK